ncbi:hypothetical protein LFX25_20005 [Leptospira sp. FAT2]|uniref:hypothetical protein n=1 Tax=Leptospira sanjuanensis TaxID=2879643 RepID=UPI001EE95C08|nr:hypothetical protein [Leptospira sanjuanensis]MCG6195529.1 hypothetical protein [Leptospira sanjuanensis]
MNEKKIVTLKEHFKDIISDKQGLIKKSVIPIYIMNKSKVYQLGSAVLITLDSKYFLISAAHVLMDNGTEYYAPYLGDIYKISGVITGVYVEEITKRKEDKYDFAILELDEVCLNGLKNDYEFLTLANIDIDHKFDLKNFYSVAGFPGEHNNKLIDNDQKKIKSIIYFIFDHPELDNHIYSAIKAEKHAHLLVKYDIDNVANEENIPCIGITPHGMSGGGIFWISDIITETKNSKKLVAVSIEYHKKQNVIMGIRIHVILEAIRQLHDVKFPFDISTLTQVKIYFK